MITDEFMQKGNMSVYLIYIFRVKLLYQGPIPLWFLITHQCLPNLVEKEKKCFGVTSSSHMTVICIS